MSFGTKERDLMTVQERFSAMRKMQNRFQQLEILSCNCWVDSKYLLNQNTKSGTDCHNGMEVSVQGKKQRVRIVRVHHILKSRMCIPGKFYVLHHDFCCCKGCENPEHSKMGSSSENKIGIIRSSFEEQNQEQAKLLNRILHTDSILVTDLAEWCGTTPSALIRFCELYLPEVDLSCRS